MKFTFTELTPEFTQEEQDEMDRDFWNGVGHIEFYVHVNRNDVFEIEILDWSGCLGGFGEGMGHEWGIKEGYLGYDQDVFLEGYTYSIEGVTVHWFRGDGWTTDDDSEYTPGTILESREFKSYWKTKIYNMWWFSLGYRIRNLIQKIRKRFK